MEAKHAVGGKDLRRFQVLTYDEFVEQNYDELSTICSEEGLDREYDFDRDRWCEELFDNAHGRGKGRGYAQLVWVKPPVPVEGTQL